MRKILTTQFGEPILEITKDISAGLETDFGLHRDRVPDNGWSELRRCNMETTNLKEVEFNETTSQRLIEDLAFAFGGNTKKFQKRMEEMQLFCIGIDDFNILTRAKMDIAINKENSFYKRNLDKLKNVLLGKFGQNFVDELEYIINDSCATGKFEFENEPTGVHQEENLDFIKEIWIDQSTGSYEDDYYGTFSIKIAEKKYVKFYYQM